MTFFIVFTLSILLYFLPCAVANMTDNKNWLAIFLLNLFLGWTLVGWVIALVWAAKKDVVPQIVIQNGVK